MAAISAEDHPASRAEVARANVNAWRQPGALDDERTYPLGRFSAPSVLLARWSLPRPITYAAVTTTLPTK